MRLIDADALVKDLNTIWFKDRGNCLDVFSCVKEAPTIAGWIPTADRLPKVGQVVLLSTTDGAVVIGHREKPDLIWQVTEEDGRKHWVYDPESYDADIDELPKSEDCGFAEECEYSDGMLSVTSPNYDDRFGGVIAWMPLPEPYREDGEA